MGADRFRLRRVLIGVLVGLVALTLGFYGWVQFRQSQYQDRERAVLVRYHDDYSLCLKLGAGDYGCAQRVLAACIVDPFWSDGRPFASAGAAPLDAPGRCRAVALTS
ncbi:MAG: hypothetical protein QOH89_1980 [Pseudonocardiales bacterium]|jgi:hypothetical protein|nr:hypothetical protein [Pseudonocardiales bacterium]